MIGNHTPGPWYTCCASSAAHYIFANDCEITICQPCHNDPDLEGYQPFGGILKMEQRLANAHLISAAPDLLEALEKCLDIIHPPGSSIEQCWKSVDEIDAAWDSGAAAIAKAKGEKP